jgi:hypothetical protein
VGLHRPRGIDQDGVNVPEVPSLSEEALVNHTPDQDLPLNCTEALSLYTPFSLNRSPL